MDLTPLRAQLRGELITRDHPAYDDARRIWSGAFDRHPLAVARCRSVQDVVAGLRFARENDLLLAVRGGGHSLAGLSTCDDGLVLDLGPLDHVAVDAGARTAVAGAGNTWGSYDAATQRYGMASPGGEISDTGIAGLTLGGGIGWLGRHHGLACDNLLEARVVTADGRVVRAATDEHPDLFWGLRGGGGNFGIVTDFTYRIHPVGPQVPVAVAVHTADDFAQAFLDLQACGLQNPDPIGLNVAMVTAPPLPNIPAHLHGQHVAVVVASCTAGGHEDALEEVLRCGTPVATELATMPYVALQSVVDEAVPRGTGTYVKSEFLRPLTLEVVERLVEGWTTATSLMSQVLLRQVGGAIAEVPHGETAYVHRDATWMLTVAAMWADPTADGAPHEEWARRVWTDASAASNGGTYVNHLAPDDAHRRREAYDPETWQRLVEVKTTWDPDNVFRLNQNVPPRTAVTA